MRITRLWRYPVKSMQGESIDASEVGDRGLTGDRQWAVINLATGRALTARREPRLLYATARLVGDNEVAVTLPDGSVARDDAALSAWLGYDAELRRASEDARGTYEIAEDFEHEDTSNWITWQGPRGSFHDSNRTMVSLVSEAAMGEWDQRRFRINVIVDGDDEDTFIGGRIAVGSVVLEIVKPISRCVITTRPQPGGIERDLDVLRTINARRDGNLGIGGLVVETGRIAVGDEVVAVLTTHN